MPSPLELPPEMLEKLWRVSPAATAATLSRYDPVPWQPFRHLMILSDVIRNAVLGRGPKFIIVNMPPRHGKSWFCSKWVPVWFLENWPARRVMMCGYGANFASEWGREVRNVVTGAKDELSFQLSEDSKAANKWRTNQNGGMVTAGVGGDITGRGANLLIIDDPVKNAVEANSRTYRDSLWAWWTSTARTRLEPGGVILVIMTRWHEDDMAGRLLDPDWNEDHASWHVVNMPAIYDAVAQKQGVDRLGRTLGQALCPERYDETALASIMRGVGPADWASLYQGRPARTAGVGSVYTEFSATENMMRLDRDPSLPLFWSLDFNVDPMCSVVGQNREQNTRLTHLTNEKLRTSEVLQEIVLPNSTTVKMCSAFIERTREYVRIARGRPIKLEVFGDVSGNKRTTNGSDTDWQLIKQFLWRYPEFNVTFHIAKDNPAVRDRTNAVNAALKSADGYRRLQVDYSCTGLKKDLEQVKWKLDSGGNSIGDIDKSDVTISHLSDALGYVIYRKYGIRSVAGEQAGLLR